MPNAIGELPTTNTPGEAPAASKVRPLGLHPKAIDLTGQRFGRWTVTGFAGYRAYESGRREAMWHSTCDCGETAAVRACHLRSGHTSSCGCYHREQTIRRSTTHGQADRPLYKVWCNMVQRCTNPSADRYPQYGGRGITVCEQWRNSFEAFFADMGEQPEGTSLDRIDVDGNYEPGNCRWATDEVQRRNKRCNRWIEYQGARMTLTDWGAALGVGESTLRVRLDRLGWSVERALTDSVDQGRLAAAIAAHTGTTAEGQIQRRAPGGHL